MAHKAEKGRNESMAPTTEEAERKSERESTQHCHDNAGAN